MTIFFGFNDLVRRLSSLSERCSILLQRINEGNPYDEIVRKSLVLYKSKIQAFTLFLETNHPLSLLYSDSNLYIKSEKEMIEGVSEFQEMLPKEVLEWRTRLADNLYADIPPKHRKEIFDYYFRDDLYGSFFDNSINVLSRGINDPEWFTPPSVVQCALLAAGDNNWFGYSHSLGHTDTRNSILHLEKHRRRNDQLTINNVAVMQGNTCGLNAILSMISLEKGHDSICALITPTYPPIFDDAQNHFNIKNFPLDKDHRIDYDAMMSYIAESKNVAVFLFSIPHNPFSEDYSLPKIKEVIRLCKDKDIYVVMDEIIFDPKFSSYFNPISDSNLIILSSYSKLYNIAGLKLGHMLACGSFMNRFYRHASTSYGSPPSFFYLTSTCINNLDSSTAWGVKVTDFLSDLRGKVSDPLIIESEFTIWSLFNEINKDYQNLLVKYYKEEIGYLGIKRFLGLSDNSPNILVEVLGSGSSYKDSITLLANESVSVMPIECFMPDVIAVKSFRITVANEPFSLANGLASFIRSNDEIYCLNQIGEMDKATRMWLEHVGLFNHYQNYNCWSHAFRAYRRLEEIYQLFDADKLILNVKDVMMLSSIAFTWERMTESERAVKYFEITGEKYGESSNNLSEILICLLERPGQLSFLPRIPETIKRHLRSFFSEEFSKDFKIYNIEDLQSFNWLDLATSKSLANSCLFRESSFNVYQEYTSNNVLNMAKELQWVALNSVHDITKSLDGSDQARCYKNIEKLGKNISYVDRINKSRGNNQFQCISL